MSKRMRIILLVLCLLSLGIYAIVYSFIPPFIPIHWNDASVIDRWSYKSFGIIFAVLPLLALIGLSLLPAIDPKRENYAKHQKAYEAFCVSIVVVLILLHWFMVLAAVGIYLPVTSLIMALVGLLMLVLGNYMPQLRPNYFLGIRTPWTLVDPDVWRKTNRLGGIAFCISGVLMMIAAFINNTVLLNFTIVFIVVLIVSVSLYSYILYRKNTRAKKQEDNNAEN